MDSIFNKGRASYFITRINLLNKDAIPKWGKMNCAQMFAHCAGAFEEKNIKLDIFSKFRIRLTKREIVIGEKPYPKNMKTSKLFTVSDKRVFEFEKARLIKGIKRVQSLGERYFLNQRHPIFGKITIEEWNTFFTKHLDHHLRQFGV